ncbi:MbtH family NRPS accessory protein [Duganella sp. FT92W]|uniref:MbtH family NRPS accessory protein n=1 Tax=Pseudoduganella rivuli TaxID=2666085 RepID=A0A7X2LTM1_9BURK|nr:MbtH family NRPS accessory protein [Pseudoduganella rivuli]MRV71999.1 MbtH family NRPS accessory protein [Pseudoduganella rivuli]
MDGFIQFQVVHNHELQYSIWPCDREVPPGWLAEGYSGTKDACLSHIAMIWKDIRPQSLIG